MNSNPQRSVATADELTERHVKLDSSIPMRDRVKPTPTEVLLRQSDDDELRDVAFLGYN